MRNLPNIEPSSFHPGQYVGYSGTGRVWRIHRNKYEWVAVAQLHSNEKPLPYHTKFFPTLTAASEALSSLD